MIILDFNMVISTMCNPGIMVCAANCIIYLQLIPYQMKSVQVVRQNNFVAGNDLFK